MLFNIGKDGRRFLAKILLICFLFSSIGIAPINTYADEEEPIEIVLLVNTTSLIGSLNNAYNLLLADGHNIDCKIYDPDELADESKRSDIISEMENSDIVILEMVSDMSAIGPVIENLPETVKIFSTRSLINEVDYPRADSSEAENLAAYIEAGMTENIKRLILYIAELVGYAVAEDISVVETPSSFIYHPEALDIKFDVDQLYENINIKINEENSKELNLSVINQAFYHTYRAIDEKDNAKEIEKPLANVVISDIFESEFEDVSIASGATVTFIPCEPIIFASGATITFAPEGTNVDPEDYEEDLYIIAKGIYDAETENKINLLGDAIRERFLEILNTYDYDSMFEFMESAYNLVFENGVQVQAELNEVFQNMEQILKSTEDDTVINQEYLINSENIYQILKNNSRGNLPPGTFKTIEGYISWYKAIGKYEENGHNIGALTYDSSFKNEDTRTFDMLIQKLEERNANVVMVYSGTSDRRSKVEEFLFNENFSMEAYIASIRFNYFSDPEDGFSLFDEINVPVLSPVNTDDLDFWEESKQGLSPSYVTYQLIQPELDGRIEPVFISGKKDILLNGEMVAKDIPYEPGVERCAERALSWANLKSKDNGEKKIAIVYYNHHGGKDDIGASYLNSIDSISAVLDKLSVSGYDVEGDISSESIYDMIMNSGRNIGTWAPGELESLVDNGAITISVDEYMEWFNELPSEMQDAVVGEWGPAPGNIMVLDDKIVIPGSFYGNVYVGPQPLRGWGDNPSAIAHSTELPPTHQYIAYYLWLQKEYQADALIHMGTHGTLEFLPGRTNALGATDWSDLLLGNMPNVYPYIMNNPGEGITAKRRSMGVALTHMIPLMIEPELYGNLAVVQEKILDYENAVTNSEAERAALLETEIRVLVTENNLDTILGVDLIETPFDQIVTELHEYIEEYAEELMPYGLHTLGKILEGDDLEAMVDAIVNKDPENREAIRDEIRESLLLVTQELDNIIEVLNGGFVKTSLGRDPLRVPDALPTGNNMVTFDARMVPDDIAWEIGSSAADNLISEYFSEHGEYPDSIGVVLFAGEAMRTQGESIALALRLMGVEPKYDSRGRITDVNITDVEELGRPRVNVVLTISGVFRDTFSYAIEILDEAIKKVSALEESEEDNRIRKISNLLYESLIGAGYSEEEALTLSTARIFGEAPGTYGNGVADIVETTSAWDSTNDIVDTYVNRMSFVYGSGVYGQESRSVFEGLLSTANMITQIADSVWGVLDNDDKSAYMGGFQLSAQKYSGNPVDNYVVNTRTGAAKVQTMERFINTELATRVLNPDYIQGLLNEGYSGGYALGKGIGHLFLADATMDVVSDKNWNDVMTAYISNDAVFNQLNPAIRQSIVAWNLEAARRDMWNASQEQLAELTNKYIQDTVNYGVVCCHHTCGNVTFNQWLADFSTLSNDIVSDFEEIFKEATNKDLDIEYKSEVPVTPSRSDDTDRVSQTDDLVDAPEVKVDEVVPTEPEKTTEESPKIAEEPIKEPIKVLENNSLDKDQVDVGEKEEGVSLETENNPLSAAGKENSAESNSSENSKDKAKVDLPSNTKAYEVQMEQLEEDDPLINNKGVAFAGIVAALAIVGIFMKGYIFKK